MNTGDWYRHRTSQEVYYIQGVANTHTDWPLIIVYYDFHGRLWACTEEKFRADYEPIKQESSHA